MDVAQLKSSYRRIEVLCCFMTLKTNNIKQILRSPRKYQKPLNVAGGDEQEQANNVEEPAKEQPPRLMSKL